MPTDHPPSEPSRSSPESDYPAAHSMDSCWFAVDRDGRVGFFKTGEAGAQPTGGLFGRPAELAGRRLAGAVPAGDFAVDLRGHLLPYLKGGGMWHPFAGPHFPLVMFLDALDPVRDALADGRATEVKARDGFAVCWWGLSDAERDRLHAGPRAACRGCFWAFDLLEDQDPDAEPRVNLARHGVYVYSALGGNASANPYGVQFVPARPVHVDQLPPDLRTWLKKVQFEQVSFADTPVFQPAEHVPCTAYENVYTDMDGRPHRLPHVESLPVDEELRRIEEVVEAEEDTDLGDRPAG
jgi:hypothetical protein